MRKKLKEQLTELQDLKVKVDILSRELHNHKEKHYRYVTSEELTNVYEHTTNALTIERNGKRLILKEVLEAILDYYEYDVIEIERHLVLQPRGE